MSSLLLFSEILFFWCLATATHHVNVRWSAWRANEIPLAPVGPAGRAVAIAAGVLLSTWAVTPATVLLAILAAATVLVLFAGRPRATPVGLLAELELAMVALFAASAGAVIWVGGLRVGFPLLRVSIADQHLAFIYLAASGMVLAVWQSGNLVRGFLQKSGVVPRIEEGEQEPAGTPDTEDASESEANGPSGLKHGRLIGYLERILIVVLVVKGSYEGLGFLVAAKGLIRAREFEDRHLAEYFLVGSLLSVVCALAIGLAIQYASTLLW
jgi:hypothetical protein